MPSPCAVFTSAPSFNSALTASWLPCMAASTTEVAGVAAYRSAEKHSPIALVEIKVRRIVNLQPPGLPRGSSPLRRRLRRRCRRDVVQIQLACTVSELLHVVATEHVQHGQH